MIAKLLVFLGVWVCTAAAADPAWVPYARNDSLRETWLHKHEVLLNQTHTIGSEIKIVFLGDSITEGWQWNGKQVWAQHYATRHAYNYGISADHTGHVLWRIAHGEFDKIQPKVIVLMIGTNNLNYDHSADIAMGIFVILDELRKKMPHTKVILLSLLPREPIALDTKVHEVNGMIARFGDNNRVHYLDLTKQFETGPGHERAELFNSDHIHLSVKGYELWYHAMESTLAKLII